jgi:hypothetical protein
MTDNEKAATYLGWIPFSEEEVCRCAEKRNYHLMVKVPNKVPDMTRPENYMRALERLPGKWEIQIEQFRGEDGLLWYVTPYIGVCDKVGPTIMANPVAKRP